ncbi:7022_t:CDS:2 [Ambispora leptoticha]|uniref:7022_t:CDS:1 n=1 Tax=Ambispora leptoticha TaxID=144679 RepID=A0A9N9A235_9GLOM|nr:7022_t:CDS:2 [Ambispora leptoticha]
MTEDSLHAIIGIHESYTRSLILETLKINFPNIQINIISPNNASFRTNKTISSPTFYWLEYEDIDFEQLYDNSKITLANSYCIRKGLIRKAQLNFNLNKYISKRPNCSLVRAVPETWVFEVAHVDYFDEALDDVFEVVTECEANKQIENFEGKHVFILKPNLGNKAASVLVFDSIEQLRAVFEHVSSSRMVSNIKVYLYKDMLALFALLPYIPNEIQNTFSHITNTCIQTSEVTFVESDQVKLFWDLSDNDHDEHKNTNGVTKEDLLAIFNQIKKILSECFEAVVSEVTQFMPMENAFELFGFDFLVDVNKQVYILEANSFPDFKQTGDRLSHVIANLFKETVELAVVPFFSENVVKVDSNEKNEDSRFVLVYER